MFLTIVDKIRIQLKLIKNLARNPKFWIILCIDAVLVDAGAFSGLCHSDLCHSF